MNSKERDRAWYLRANHIRSRQNKVKWVMKRIFIQQEDDVISNLEKHFKNEKGIKGFSLTGVVFDKDKWDSIVDKRLRAQIKGAVEEMGKLYAGENFNLNHPVVMQAIEHYVHETVPEINKTTFKKLNESLQEGISQGESVRDLVHRVQNVFQDASGRRAIVIARTVAFGSSNLGLQHGMEQGGWERKMWLTSRDSRVRPSHRIDGQVVPVNKPFILEDGREMMYPHDINERCTMIATGEPVSRGESPNYYDFMQKRDYKELDKLLKDNYYENVVNNYDLIDSLDAYKARMYELINMYLRKGEKETSKYLLGKFKDKRKVEMLLKKIKVHTKNIEKALKSHTINKDLILYRNGGEITNLFDGVDSLQERYLKNLIGSYIQDDGFMSTTLDRNLVENWKTGKNTYMLKIKAGKGFNGLAMDGRAEGSEAEILLQKGKKIKITSVIKNPEFESKGGVEWIVEGILE